MNEDVDLERVDELLKLNDKNQLSLLRIVVDGEINGKSRFVDDDLTGDQVLTVAKRFEKSDELKSLRNIRIIGEGPNGEALFMRRQDIDHAIERHVFGDDVDTKAETTFYPTGRIIDNDNIDGPVKLPSKMDGDYQKLRYNIMELAYKSIKHGEIDGSNIKYSLSSQNGIEEIVLNRKGHRIRSIYPKNGPAVRRWNGEWNNGQGRWEKWDENKNDWVEWEENERSTMILRISSISTETAPIRKSA